MMFNHRNSFIFFLGILLFASLTEGGKVKRVKAGKTYKQHDPVHLVVNKVGYVGTTSVVGLYRVLPTATFCGLKMKAMTDYHHHHWLQSSRIVPNRN